MQYPRTRWAERFLPTPSRNRYGARAGLVRSGSRSLSGLPASAARPATSALRRAPVRAGVTAPRRRRLGGVASPSTKPQASDEATGGAATRPFASKGEAGACSILANADRRFGRAAAVPHGGRRAPASARSGSRRTPIWPSRDGWFGTAAKRSIDLHGAPAQRLWKGPGFERRRTQGEEHGLAGCTTGSNCQPNSLAAPCRPLPGSGRTPDHHVGIAARSA
jgi:hypothetical protein